MTKHYMLQALNENKESVYIDDVPNGKSCNCTCAECGGKLVAKNNGKIKVHHFAHENGNDNIRCSETSLHLLAKKIIVEEKKIPFLVNDGQIVFVPVEAVEEEKNLGDIKPDLYAVYNEKPVAIEIYVSHAVDEIKFKKIQNHKLTTFEINLSKKIFEKKSEVEWAIHDINNINPIYDEIYTEQFLLEKKKFIDEQGIKKSIEFENVFQCPMKWELRSMMFSPGAVKPSLCEICPFGYRDENFVRCIGHLNMDVVKFLLSRQMKKRMTLSCDYWWRINVTRQKVSSLEELAVYFERVTKRKFTVSKQIIK